MGLFLTRCLVSALLLLSPLVSAEPLRVGLFPNLSPITLITMYQPMRDYLQQALGRKVEFETAPDFHAFSERLLAREYDLAVAAPHLARMGQTDAGYRLIARYEQPVEACLVVPASSPHRKPVELRGAVIAIPDTVAIVGHLGGEILAKAGLKEGRDYRLQEAKSHSNAALGVLNKQTDAAIVGCLPLSQMAPDIRQRLHILAKSRRIPGQYFLAADRLGRQEQERLARLLFEFGQTEAGRKFLSSNSLLGIANVSQGELKSLDPYARLARQHLTTHRH